MPSGKETSVFKNPSRDQRAFQGLQITSTPIGNLGDLSPRAQATLENADLIACEDTRHTGLLLSRLGVSTQMVPYHDHSGDHVIDRLIKAMKSGKTVTLVSDAGTPLISDPGYRLVAACREHDIPVTSIPGPSAILAALAASGLPTDRFYFAGFIPTSSKKRMDMLTSLLPITATLIFYESPKRIAATLKTMVELYPERQVVVARELTKLHEEFYRGTVQSLYHEMEGQTLKGELVLMLGPLEQSEKLTNDDLAEMLTRALSDGMSRRDAVTTVASNTGHAKKHVYSIALGLMDAPRERET